MPAIASSAAPDIDAKRLLSARATATRSPRFYFGFRLAKRAVDLSAGTHGAFTTTAQSDSSGSFDITSITAPDLKLHFRRSPSSGYVTVVVSFDVSATNFGVGEKGWYSPQTQDLVLNFVVKHSNDPRCRAGHLGGFSMFSARNLSSMQICGQVEYFLHSKQATYRVKPGA
jgi:hypothetical protein